jgi:hypothetical protein
MIACAPSKMGSSTKTREPHKAWKRARDDEPANQDSESQNRNKSRRPPGSQRRERALPYCTIDDEESLTVDDQPSKPKQKQKPGPKPGFKFPTKAESPPPWSWDVTGQWTLSCPQLGEILELDDSASQKMTIHLANNPRHTKDGRQYWATFDFGNGCLTGNMRFCPHVDLSIRDDIDLEDFEKACVLRNGEWVGPSPTGVQKWNLRWRGVDVDTGVVEGSGDQHQTDIEFKRGEDEKLTLSAVFVFRFQQVELRGVKASEAKPLPGNGPAVARTWLRYKPKHI